MKARKTQKIVSGLGFQKGQQFTPLVVRACALMGKDAVRESSHAMELKKGRAKQLGVSNEWWWSSCVVINPKEADNTTIWGDPTPYALLRIIDWFCSPKPVTPIQLWYVVDAACIHLWTLILAFARMGTPLTCTTHAAITCNEVEKK